MSKVKTETEEMIKKHYLDHEKIHRKQKELDEYIDRNNVMEELLIKMKNMNLEVIENAADIENEKIQLENEIAKLISKIARLTLEINKMKNEDEIINFLLTAMNGEDRDLISLRLKQHLGYRDIAEVLNTNKTSISRRYIKLIEDIDEYIKSYKDGSINTILGQSGPKKGQNTAKKVHMKNFEMLESNCDKLINS